MRGEYRYGFLPLSLVGELPPHARRIPVFPNHLASLLGTTSACAENTSPVIFQQTTPWNYLRMRGEYPATLFQSATIPELPPHARRIRYENPQRGVLAGTTSACAENTGQRAERSLRRRNYLRMRGEYTISLIP